MNFFLKEEYESEPWTIRAEPATECVRALVRPFLFTLGYTATDTSDSLTLTFSPKTTKRNPEDAIPDEVRCSIRPATGGTTEVSISSVLERDTFLALLRERFKFGGFTLAVAFVLSIREWTHSWQPDIFFGAVGLVALLTLTYFVRFSLHSTRFDKREIELVTQVAKKIEDKFPGTTLALPSPNARFFSPIAIGLAVDLTFCSFLGLVFGFPPWLVLVAAPIIFGLLIGLVRTKQWHSRIGMIVVNYAVAIAIAVFYHVIPAPVLLGREPLSEVVGKAEERIRHDESMLATAKDANAAQRDRVAAQIREKKIILAIFRKAHLFSFGVVVLVCGTWMLLVPSLVRVRQLAFHRREYPGRGFRGIAIASWLVIAAALIHAIWICQAVVVNLLAGRTVISGATIEGTQADTLFLFADLARDCGSSSPQKIAWWGALVFSSVLPLAYIIWVACSFLGRLRTYLRLTRCDITSKVRHLLHDPSGRLRICLSERPELHARALYFALSRADIIEVSAATVNLPDDQLKALLVHEAHHIEKDVRKLWWAALLSRLSLCGSGFFYILFNTHEIEYAADDRAVQAMGGSRNAVDVYADLLKKVERSHRLHHCLPADPVGAFYAFTEPGMRSRIRGFIEAFRILFGTNTPYVHPPRDVRVERLMNKYPTMI